MTARNLIELRNASVASASSLGETPVLENVNWQVNEGEFWLVGGLPGSGKTDLMATASGLQKPVAGDHFLFGRRFSDLEEPEILDCRLRVGMVFDRGGRLFSTLTVAENLALPLAYHQNMRPDETQHEVDAVMEWTGLCDVRHKLPGDLPRGARQRVGLARALMLEPEVLLLDNPLGGVEARQTGWWREFLARLHKEGSPKRHRKPAIVLAADDLGPWSGAGNRFATIRGKEWIVLRDRAALAGSHEPIFHEPLSNA